MKRRHLLIYAGIAVLLLLTVTYLMGAGVVVEFQASDESGPWFDSGVDIAGTRSLAIVHPGDTVSFKIGQYSKLTATTHTVLSLLWPTGATGMPVDAQPAFWGSEKVTLYTPGLYVFICKVHPYMFAAVIVDDPGTKELDLGKTVTLINGVTVPTASDLALRLVRAFFIITNPKNWQDFNPATNRTGKWDPSYPAVSVLAYDVNGNKVSIGNLDTFLGSYFGEPVTLPGLFNPTTAGVGEVWVDTQFEHTKSKIKPGTISVVDATTWKVTKKYGLPEVNLNNPHNMWTDRNQTTIYVTEWFDHMLDAIDRKTGLFVNRHSVGESPAHVITSPATDNVYVSVNSEDEVIEFGPLLSSTSGTKNFPTSFKGENEAHPHGFWISPDGQTILTPNANTDTATLIDVPTVSIRAKPNIGSHPIAAAFNPKSNKWYVANFVDSTLSVIENATGSVTQTINLLANYNPITGAITGPVGALPIQSPVSPDGKFVVTANTLTATITVINTATNTVVAMLPCGPGCHGANWGAKSGGGYYAYVTSKFANMLIVVDPDPNNDGNAADAAIVGRILMVASKTTTLDDPVTSNAGMGGNGLLPIPVVYSGWVQNLPPEWTSLLTSNQQNP